MAGPNRGSLDLRVAAPPLEPDPVLLAQLAALARESSPTAPAVVARAGRPWTMALAAASVALIAAVGSWAAGEIGDSDSPKPPIIQPAAPDATTGEDLAGREGHGSPDRIDEPADAPEDVSGTGEGGQRSTDDSGDDGSDTSESGEDGSDTGDSGEDGSDTADSGDAGSGSGSSGSDDQGSGSSGSGGSGDSDDDAEDPDDDSSGSGSDGSGGDGSDEPDEPDEPDDSGGSGSGKGSSGSGSDLTGAGD